MLRQFPSAATRATLIPFFLENDFPVQDPVHVVQYRDCRPDGFVLIRMPHVNQTDELVCPLRQLAMLFPEFTKWLTPVNSGTLLG